MIRAYRFRIYPNKEQEVLFRKTFGCCRFLYNHMLSDRMDEYERNGSCRRLTPAMYKGEYPWLKEVDSLALANVQLHLEQAWKRFFSSSSQGMPRFKSKHRSRKSYTTNVVNGNIRLENGRLRLPKAGYVRIRQHRDLPAEGRLKAVTVSMEPSGKYFASLLWERPEHENQVNRQRGTARKILGVDFAMRGMAVFSDMACSEYICSTNWKNGAENSSMWIASFLPASAAAAAAGRRRNCGWMSGYTAVSAETVWIGMSMQRSIYAKKAAVSYRPRRRRIKEREQLTI